MDKSGFVRIIILVHLCLATLFFVYVNIEKPRVFIVHSYNLDFSWDIDIDKGIHRIFNMKSYKIRTYYMDTKRHPDKEYMMRIGAAVRHEIDAWLPDVIIVLDDNAQEHIAKYYVNHPSIKIVFAGINKTEQDYGYDKANNVTGMLERINYHATKDFLLQVLPSNKRRIVHISDSSETSQGIHQEIESFDWKPLTFISSIQCETFDDWKKNLTTVAGQADFILYTHYHTIRESKSKNAKIVPPKTVMKWTIENSDLPAVSFWGFYVEDGGMMAFALSPYEQGESAAKMAVEIIDHNVSPKNIRVRTSYLFIPYIRESEVKKRLGNIKLPLVYEAFSKASNTYYE